MSTYAVNMIVNNTLDELLTSVDTGTAVEEVAVSFLILIFWMFTCFGVLYAFAD